MKWIGLTVDGMDARGCRTPAMLVANSHSEVFMMTRGRLPHMRECEVCGDLYDGRGECAICVEAMRAEAVRQSMMDGDGALNSPF